MNTTRSTAGRKIVLYSGWVQGVGFRQTTVSLARAYSIGGTVRNMDDGRVELILEGPTEEMDQLLADIEARFSGFITDVGQRTEPLEGLSPPVRIIW